MGRVALLPWLVYFVVLVGLPSCGGVAKDFSKQLPMGVGALLRWVGLPFCLVGLALLWGGWLEVLPNYFQRTGSCTHMTLPTTWWVQMVTATLITLGETAGAYA